MANEKSELSEKKMADILRNVVLGVDPPVNETDAERDWRKKMEKDVHDANAKGFMVEAPFDPE